MLFWHLLYTSLREHSSSLDAQDVKKKKNLQTTATEWDSSQKELELYYFFYLCPFTLNQGFQNVIKYIIFFYNTWQYDKAMIIRRMI